MPFVLLGLGAPACSTSPRSAPEASGPRAVEPAQSTRSGRMRAVAEADVEVGGARFDIVLEDGHPLPEDRVGFGQHWGGRRVKIRVSRSANPAPATAA